MINLENKVYLNVHESDIFYRFYEYKFYFSSRATRERFIRKLDLFIEAERNKFINKYNCSVDEESFNLMFGFILYNKTEKRGFKVERYIKSVKVKELEEMPIFRIWR